MERMATEDQPTDICSSSSTSSSAVSTPTRKIRNESEKQILQWASKLELESIELREQSAGLLKRLNSRYENLNTFTDKFTTIEESFKKQVNTMVDEFKNEIMERTEKIVTQHYKENVDRHKELTIIQNMASQMEDMQLLMISVSKELNDLNQRQSKLEQRLKTQDLKFQRNEPSTVVLLNGTTLSHDIQGPFTRSMSKTMKPDSYRVEKPVNLRVQPRTVVNIEEDSLVVPHPRHFARTIIPWEEIAENEQLANETTTCEYDEYNYPSEL